MSPISSCVNAPIKGAAWVVKQCPAVSLDSLAGETLYRLNVWHNSANCFNKHVTIPLVTAVALPVIATLGIIKTILCFPFNCCSRTACPQELKNLIAYLAMFVAIPFMLISSLNSDYFAIPQTNLKQVIRDSNKNYHHEIHPKIILLAKYYQSTNESEKEWILRELSKPIDLDVPNLDPTDKAILQYLANRQPGQALNLNDPKYKFLADNLKYAGENGDPVHYYRTSHARMAQTMYMHGLTTQDARLFNDGIEATFKILEAPKAYEFVHEEEFPQARDSKLIFGPLVKSLDSALKTSDQAGEELYTFLQDSCFNNDDKKKFFMELAIHYRRPDLVSFLLGKKFPISSKSIIEIIKEVDYCSLKQDKQEKYIKLLRICFDQITEGQFDQVTLAKFLVHACDRSSPAFVFEKLKLLNVDFDEMRDFGRANDIHHESEWRRYDASLWDTPLVYAVHRGNLDLVDILLYLGVNKNNKGAQGARFQGLTALDLATDRILHPTGFFFNKEIAQHYFTTYEAIFIMLGGKLENQNQETPKTNINSEMDVKEAAQTSLIDIRVQINKKETKEGPIYSIEYSKEILDIVLLQAKAAQTSTRPWEFFNLPENFTKGQLIKQWRIYLMIFHTDKLLRFGHHTLINQGNEITALTNSIKEKCEAELELRKRKSKR